ncbi:MAG: GNAT family N-acetyltransferase [Paraburkholderia fungorum]|jgi:ribosomal protein S18 acetylase RimI-like enzyme|nr:GNAT family N-acetyltransferase [Paraburkholderia fungorum]
MVKIYPARFPEQLEVVREIFREYAESLGVDLSFQDFESELAELPGKFAAPRGCVLLAQDNQDVVGCVAMRPLDNSTCEMKRLYTRPSGRGQQVGRQLATLICRIARQAGYTRIRLDTLPDMRAAQRLYAQLGFKPIPAYVFNPIAGTIFLERDLTGPEI